MGYDLFHVSAGVLADNGSFARLSLFSSFHLAASGVLVHVLKEVFGAAVKQNLLGVSVASIFHPFAAKARKMFSRTRVGMLGNVKYVAPCGSPASISFASIWVERS